MDYHPQAGRLYHFHQSVLPLALKGIGATPEEKSCRSGLCRISFVKAAFAVYDR